MLAAVALAFLLAGGAQPADPEAPKLAGTEVPAPKRTKFVQPRYPAEAQAKGLRGIVILEVVIDERGKITSVEVVRSLPPFDEAALEAVKQWEYEPTRFEGRPVRVRHSIPITFAMRLPTMSRDAGIPELRQGVGPTFPPGATGREGASVGAELIVDPHGQVIEAQINKGDPPWTESLLQAIRTWRFTPLGADELLVFQVDVEFVAAGREGPRVDLKLSSPRRRDATLRTEPEPAPPQAQPSPPAPGPAAGTPEPAKPPAAEPAPAPSPLPADRPAGAVPDAGTPAPPTPSARPTPPPAPAAAAPPAPATAPPAAAGPAPATSTAAAPARSGPEEEVVPPQPPAPTPPPPPGVSVVRDVVLGLGVPDLMKGRRPVVPPLARMQAVTGRVEVRFMVDAAGSPSVRQVSGPDLLQEAARQTVGSWGFRRTSPERLALVATLDYGRESASAAIALAEP